MMQLNMLNKTTLLPSQSKFEGVALIVGNESLGVSQTALDKCSTSVHIDMYGNNSSMNVSSALAIVLYKYCEDFISSSI